MDITQLAIALGSSLTAGLNLYITVLSLGLMQRFGILSLPGNLDTLGHTWVLVAATVLLAVELVADKVPYVDNLWDAIHTFIRIPAGAIIAGSAMTDLPPHIVWIAALAGGFVSLAAHGAKASTRLAVNATPEPFTNWFLSFVEDGVSVGLMVLVATHPYLAVAVSLLLIGLFAAVIYLFYRFFKMIFRIGSASSYRAGGPVRL